MPLKLLKSKARHAGLMFALVSITTYALAGDLFVINNNETPSSLKGRDCLTIPGTRTACSPFFTVKPGQTAYENVADNHAMKIGTLKASFEILPSSRTIACDKQFDVYQASVAIVDVQYTSSTYYCTIQIP